MDRDRFDNLAKAMARGVSRRDVLRGMLGGVAAGAAITVMPKLAIAQDTCAGSGDECEMVEGSCCSPYTCFEAICGIPRGCVGEDLPCVDDYPCCEDEGLSCVDGVCAVAVDDGNRADTVNTAQSLILATGIIVHAWQVFADAPSRDTANRLKAGVWRATRTFHHLALVTAAGAGVLRDRQFRHHRDGCPGGHPAKHAPQYIATADPSCHRFRQIVEPVPVHDSLLHGLERPIGAHHRKRCGTILVSCVPQCDVPRIIHATPPCATVIRLCYYVRTQLSLIHI